MKINGVVLAASYAIVATASSWSATGDTAGPEPGGGATINMDCKKETTSTSTVSELIITTATSTVSEPNTTVTVTCGEQCTVEPTGAENIFLDAECDKKGVLSSVCPGATVSPLTEVKKLASEKKVDVFFPQLPPSAQVVCLKCKDTKKECKAVISVAAAPPQGPQACAVAGSSVTLRIKEAGGSAQFACGTGRSLMPTEATKAYSEDCTKEETLKGMTRTPGTYETLKVDKPKKKRLCFLCKQRADVGQTRKEAAPCTIYIEVSGSSRLYSNARFGVPLLCVAASLRFF